MKWRPWFVLSVFLIAFLAVIGNLYKLQLLDGPLYAARAAAQEEARGALDSHRGTIFFTDKSGSRISAALNRIYPIVFASPKQIQDVPEASAALASILNIAPETLAKRLSKKNTYELLGTKLSSETIAAVRGAAVPGVYIDSQEFRFYPFGSRAAHLLGFVAPVADDDRARGRYGIEAEFDERLSGVVRGDAEGRFATPVDGEDVALTIDSNIQLQAESILIPLVESRHATGGTIIVQEPSTGKILALANAPTFDPNEYGKSPIGNYLNPAVQSVYEPGSVFKVLTMAAGIEAGKITPETTFTDTGSLTLNGKTISNYAKKAYGKVTMTQVIENSINTGAAFAEKKMGHAIFKRFVEAFGISEKTGIELPGEVKGSMRGLVVDPRDINFATAAFGQGIALTPIRLIVAVSALANGGVMMPPSIMRGEAPKEGRRVVSSATAEAVTAMMVSAVEKAQIARIPSYRVAGKTGTAQIADSVRGGYRDEFIHTYVGFAPASKPRFTILVKLDRPQGPPLAGATVVPAFRELAEFLLNYYNIPPDHLKETSGE